MGGRPLAPDFWGNVAVGAPDECWDWQRAVDSYGYGVLHTPDGRRVFAHRHAYTITYGAIPDGAVVMHVCDRPLCVNPAHLRAGSHADNSRDMSIKGRGRHGTRTTPEDVRAIRAEYARGVRQSELAARYGLTQSAVSLIVNDKNWKGL